MYEVQWGTQVIRIIVLSQVPKVKRNAIWQLFGGIAEQAQYGASHYPWRRKDHSTIIKKLYQHYQVEGITMPYTWDDFYREFTREHLDLLPVEDRLKGLPIEAFLKHMPAAEIEAYLKKLRQKKPEK